MTDYRALLVKYMKHVLAEEGTTFVFDPDPRWGIRSTAPEEFTVKEWDLLLEVNREVTV